MKREYVHFFQEISKKDIPLVGGKNASLGEMSRELSKKGVNIPPGFALNTKAYRRFFEFNKIDEKLKEIFAKFNPKSIKSLQETGRAARALIMKGDFPDDIKEEAILAYKKLSDEYGIEEIEVAVRSSGVAEDAPTMSFAGQFESFLNVKGEEELLEAIKKCLASAFGDRVIVYREERKVPHLKFALSVGVQKMIRSDLGGASGIMFTIDTESGFSNVVLINSVFGIGEEIVKGRLTPDEFYVFKPTGAIILKNLSPDHKEFSLSDQEISKLAQWALIIERHYGLPQDIEWAKDGRTGELFIVQSRPETIHRAKEAEFYEEYQLKTDKKPLLKGVAVGSKIGQGKVRIIKDVSKISQFQKGEILVTQMTDPDWVSIFPLASAIVTDEGGKTSHAAIISRELGLPCIVGTQNATKILKQGQEITVDCTQGSEGRVFLGKVPFSVKKYDLKKIPKIKTKIMVNIGAPEIAFKTSFLPVAGVGLARQEFIIAEKIRIHPLALYHYRKIKDQKSKIKDINQKLKVNRIIETIEKLTIEHKDKREYFVKELAEGIAQIAAAFWPKPVIVRLSDLKSNEYQALIGGELFEPKEANPMLGWRGASRYYDQKFRPAFKMEIQALKRARETFGLKNIKVMVPFCRTVEEGEKVLKLMKEYGLERGKDGLEVYVMCEIPSNVILADKFLDIFDGMSIGSNDLTQLVLGVDRDSALMGSLGDERNEAVKEMIAKVIQICKKRKKYSGICGQAPSDFPDFADFLIKQGIDSISLNPDTVIKTILHIARRKKK
jgi:pyruvate,water dikinase